MSPQGIYEKRVGLQRSDTFFGHNIGWFINKIFHPIELTILPDRYGNNRKCPEEAKTLPGSQEISLPLEGLKSTIYSGYSRKNGNEGFGPICVPGDC